jgi:inner membrane protein
VGKDWLTEHLNLLIAHLPSGYLLGDAAQRITGSNIRSIMTAALVGAMTPDLDMLYFHLIDGRQTHHHHYVTHWPLFWFAVSALMIFTSLMRRKRYLAPVLAFSAGALLHFFLDTVASPILWLMPFDNRQFELVQIPAVYSNWIWSFVFHWTFALEITICLAASAVYLLRRSKDGANSTKMT